MEKAIQKAIRAGYKDVSFHCSQDDLIWLMAVTSPDFWQALGKAMWNEYVAKVAPHHEWRTPDVFYRKIWGKDGHKYKEEKITHEPWLKMMHRFIDHLAEGKSADDFFSNLLK